MKFKALLLLGLLASLFFSCEKNSSNSFSFEKSYGGGLEDKANAAIILDDAIYLLGSSKSFSEPNGDFYLLKLDMEGNIIFERTYGSTAVEDGIDLVATTDGNLVLVGTTQNTASGLYDIYALKIDTNGELIWEKSIGGDLREKPANIIETNNGNYCIAGYTESYGAGGLDIYLVWLNQNGDVIREKSHGETDMDGSSQLIELENNNLMLFGYTKNYGATSRDYLLQKMDANGELIWRKRYGGDGYEESQGFVRTAEGDFVLNGHSSSTDPNHNLFVVKVDADGNELWNKNYGGAMHDGGQDILINKKGNYVCIARSMSYGAGDRNIYMMTSDSNGNILSEEVIGGAQNDWGNCILEYGSYYYIAGHSNSFGTSDDAYLVRIRK